MTPSAANRGDRGPLTVDRIIDSAILLAKAEGMAGVSMRKIARRLGVEPMSLYHHIPGKAALMLLMADRSIDQLPAPDPALSWDRQLVELLMDAFNAAIANPAMFPVLASEPLHPDSLPVTRRDDGGASLAFLERVLALLTDGGARPPIRCTPSEASSGCWSASSSDSSTGCYPQPHHQIPLQSAPTKANGSAARRC